MCECVWAGVSQSKVCVCMLPVRVVIVCMHVFVGVWAEDLICDALCSSRVEVRDNLHENTRKYFVSEQYIITIL